MFRVMSFTNTSRLVLPHLLAAKQILLSSDIRTVLSFYSYLGGNARAMTSPSGGLRDAQMILFTCIVAVLCMY